MSTAESLVEEQTENVSDELADVNARLDDVLRQRDETAQDTGAEAAEELFSTSLQHLRYKVIKFEQRLADLKSNRGPQILADELKPKILLFQKRLNDVDVAEGAPEVVESIEKHIAKLEGQVQALEGSASCAGSAAAATTATADSH